MMIIYYTTILTAFQDKIRFFLKGGIDNFDGTCYDNAKIVKRKTMKKQVKATSVLGVALSALICFCACSAQPSYDWTMSDLGDDVSIHTKAQSDYLSGDYTKISDYAKATAELSRPEPIRFTWSATPKKETEVSVSQYRVELSRSSAFSDSITYTTKELSLDVYNLYIASDYYWRVTAELSDGKKSVSEVKTFSTSGVAPRNLYVDGITNVRDLGGWETADGGRVKQGLIYRCGRLNKSEQPTVEIEITEAGIKTMLEEMGVRSEIDLRNPDNHNTETGGITSSPLGDDVAYYNCPMEWNVSNILTNNLEEVKHVFSILADESNYPVIYHCNIGTDRTGLFAFLINGLLGVSEEDLYRDYLFSNFGVINSPRTLDGIKNSYVKTVQGYPGETLSEKIENCLLQIGVTQSEIDSLRTILTED